MSKTTSEPKKRSQPENAGERLEIFKTLRKILSKYAPPLTVTSDDDSRFELVSKKPVEFMGRKKPEVYFGAAIIQGKYVGLYLMHVYVKPERLKNIAPDLLKTLKGKSCFHIKKIDPELTRQIEAAVKDGFECYKTLGFI